MPEPKRSRLPAVAAGVVAALATLAGAAGVVLAAVAGWLAQPAWAFAVRAWRGQADGMKPSLPNLLGLAGAWAAALLAGALLLAWPLGLLLRGGGAGAALGVSLAAGLWVIGLWKLWPLWHRLERDGATPATAWKQLDQVDAGSWHGLLAALLLAASAAPVLLLAWPGLLPAAARWPLASGLLLLWPLAHWWLQRLPEASATGSAAALVALDAESLARFVGEDEIAPAAAAPTEATVADLYAAARRGRVDAALQMLEAGVDAHAPPPPGEKDRRSLAVLAAVLPDLRLLRALIGRGIDLNASHAGLTPLLAATRDSWHGRPEAVMTLLANGADPRVTDAEGNTPLHHAARSSDPGVAALLRDAAAEIDVANADGVTPLGMACASGNWRLAKFLLERGARAHLAGAVPALLSAAGGDEDDAAGVQLLLRHRAQVNAVDARNRSALHEAALAGHPGIVDALLAAGASISATDAEGRTPLLDAARSGRIAVVDALQAGGADIASRDRAGQGVLAHACQAQAASPALLERLLALGADAGSADSQGRTPVQLAAEAGRWSLVAVLDPDYPLPGRVLDDAREREADAPLPDRSPQSLLHEALGEDRFDGLPAMARLLQPEELGRLLLDPAIVADPGRLDWLLRHGADPQVSDGGGDGVLFAQLRRGPSALPALQVLLDHGVAPSGRGGLALWLAASMAAAGGRDDSAAEAMAMRLLASGADPFAGSPAGDPPLAMAVRLGWQRPVEALVHAGADLDARDSHGMTALHLATALGREPVVRLLVQRGAAVDIRAPDGQTPLGIALSAGRRDLADWLDWSRWRLPGRALRATDLPAAAMLGDGDAVRRLLALGFDADTIDSQGCTALLRAAGGGHAGVVDQLLDRGADVCLAAGTGATALSAAVSMGHGGIVQRLIQAGAPLEHRLPGGITVLLLASALGLPDMVQRLLAAGADLNVRDEQQRDCMHCATLYGFAARDRARLLALLDTLLLAGAQADAEAAGGITPLLMLLGARAQPGSACDEAVVAAGLERLLDEGVRLDARESRGFGPLHLAALHGLLDITRQLLRAGADPDQRDGLNRPPRDIALMRGFVDVAAEFAPVAPGSVSMARFLREQR